MAHEDFQERLKRIRREAERQGRDVGHHAPAPKRGARPVLGLLLGFGWVFGTLELARNRAAVEDQLDAFGFLTSDMQTYLLYGMAALLMLSVVLLGYKLIQFLFNSRRRRQTAGLMTGAMAALAMNFVSLDQLSALPHRLNMSSMQFSMALDN